MKPTDDTILLVEDDPNDVLLMQRACRKANFTRRMHVVQDRESAVAYLSGHNEYADRTRYPLPVLVLLDLKLLRMSGFELLVWLRQQPLLKRLPVVVLTSSAEHADINRAYEVGANSYLVKPADLDAMVEMVKALDHYWFKLSQRPDLDHS